MCLTSSTSVRIVSLESRKPNVVNIGVPGRHNYYSLQWLCTACKTSLVSPSSCVDLSALNSVVPLDDLTSNSSLNPPGTTISLSSGACENNSWDKKLARSAFLSASERKLIQFFGRGTSRLSISRLIGREPFHAAFSCGALDCLFSVPVEHHIYPLVLRTYFKHVRVRQISKGHSVVWLSHSYQECLSINDKQDDVSWISRLSGQSLPLVITLTKSDLFPVRSVPFISASDKGTERSSCFSTACKSTGRPASFSN